MKTVELYAIIDHNFKWGAFYFYGSRGEKMDFLKLFVNDFDNLNIPTVGIIDLLDIFIVAYIIYKIIFWIKETRAWSLFKGILVIIVFTALSVVLKLNTILWILQNTISVGIIALIVVFQPEMRKALEELGKGSVLTNIFKFDIPNEQELVAEKTVDEILKACVKMASVKTGALILIQQEVPLGDHERTGIPIDSVVTSQLLINIFEKNTPLHDGAVIIRNNRVAAATCFLPLTESDTVSMDLGTRHRAALGASEVSDAYVIVVSEETGDISMARGGALYRNLSVETLRSMLYHSETVKRKFILWKGRRPDEKNERNL